MKRGEIWTVLGNSYASKPRPVLVVQANATSHAFDSVIVCLFTSSRSDDIPTRVRIEASTHNGLQKTSWVMTDKVYAARKAELGERIGMLTDEHMREVSNQLRAILEL